MESFNYCIACYHPPEMASECPWNHPNFQKTITQLIESNNLPEVPDSINPCHECKSLKTVSYTKQTRSSDEGATVFVKCTKCGARSVHNS
jgi:DNA-directed RNA polymerase subunit M/transcription elongation factor TFIIS